MRGCPPSIDGARVLLVADLEDASVTGNTRHVVYGAEVTEFYCDDAWETVTDTYHGNVEAAVSQAEFEFDLVQFRSLELNSDP